MSVFLRSLKLNRILLPSDLSRVNQLLLPTTMAMNSNRSLVNVVDNGGANSNTVQTKADATGDKLDYEGAVLKLQSLVSNAEVLAAKRADKSGRELRQMTHISNVNKFILRSGLKEEDIDKMSMIHVSGTKGKGSTCAFCERILHSKGYKTGLFSSPHLVEVRERVRINGRPVSKELYAYHFWKVYNRLKETESESEEGLPAYFAFNMILSLHIFLAEGVDVSIMEVGIGGQYDSTNFIRVPAVCGVTSLGYDHTSILGHTIEEIAWNKAGIFKTGCPAIVVQQPPAAMRVILNRAVERQSPLYIALPIDSGVLEKKKINLGICGNKQRDNASLAVQLAEMWEQRHDDKAPMKPMTSNMSKQSCVEEIPLLEISHLDACTAKGLSSCVWPGRAQTVKRQRVTYYLDGAHTRESIQVCAQWFQEKADQEKESIGGKVIRVLIFNVTGDRNGFPLLAYLKDCSFDAAGFSTNTVSTVESFNKKDQVNPMYTSSSMLKKTEENRIAWEKLIQVSSRSSTGMLNGNTVSSFSPLIDVSSVDVVKKRKLSSDTTSSASPANDKDMESFARQFSSSAFPNSLLANGHCTKPSVRSCNDKSNDNNHNNDNNNSNNNNNNNIDSAKDSNVTSHNCQSINDLDLVSDTTTMEGQSEVKATDTSHSFPCLLQALTWATQGKDSSVVNKDPNANLPPVPSSLVDADHIQVLITGSLHLVGGVLAVITPDMND